MQDFAGPSTVSIPLMTTWLYSNHIQYIHDQFNFIYSILEPYPWSIQHNLTIPGPSKIQYISNYLNFLPICPTCTVLGKTGYFQQKLNGACEHKPILSYLTCMLFPQAIDLRRHLVVVLRAPQGRSIETTGTEFAVIQLHFEADSFKTNLSLKSTHCNIHIAKVLPNHNFRMLSLYRVCPACTNDWSLLTVESSTHGIRTEWPETK